jgi:hypothetical protein
MPVAQRPARQPAARILGVFGPPRRMAWAAEAGAARQPGTVRVTRNLLTLDPVRSRKSRDLDAAGVGWQRRRGRAKVRVPSGDAGGR